MTIDTPIAYSSTRPSIEISSALGSWPASSVEAEVSVPYVEQKPERATGAREQQGFGQQLSKHAPAPRAKRRANRDLLALAQGASEQQVADIGAGDEEDQPDGAEQDQKHRAAIADDFLLHRDDHGFPASVRLAKLTRQPCGDRVHLGLRLRQFDVSLQTRDAIPIVIPTGSALLVGECERDPDVARHPGP